MDEAKSSKAWAGIDTGKEFHWAHVLDTSGTELLSRRVENDEADLLKLLEEVLSLAEDIVCGQLTSPVEARHCSWPSCGSETRGSSTSPASPSTGLATPTVGGPKPTPVMPTSSPIRLV